MKWWKIDTPFIFPKENDMTYQHNHQPVCFAHEKTQNLYPKKSTHSHYLSAKAAAAGFRLTHISSTYFSIHRIDLTLTYLGFIVIISSSILFWGAHLITIVRYFRRDSPRRIVFFYSALSKAPIVPIFWFETVRPRFVVPFVARIPFFSPPLLPPQSIPYCDPMYIM